MPRVARGGPKSIKVTEDLKNKMLDLYDNHGINLTQLGIRFRLSPSWISQLIVIQRKKNARSTLQRLSK